MIKVHEDFDILLGGGIQRKCITHIYGVPGSGKTNFALMAAASASSQGRVVYVDCEGGFSTERLKQLTGDRFRKVLERILLVEPTDFDEQKLAIKRLQALVSTEDISLIVIDSISVHYRVEEHRDVKALGRQISALLMLARKHDLPVLMVNQVYSDLDSGEMIPVGGDLTRYWSKIMIEFMRDNARGVRSAVIRKHKFLPEGMRLDFRITGSGVCVMDTRQSGEPLSVYGRSLS